MIKVILAEDHNIVRNGIKTLLEKSGDFKVIGEAINGLEVLELFKGGIVPDILLSDINMPDMSGLEVIEKIKAGFPMVKLALLTMLDNENFVLKAFEIGAHGYLLKSITSDEMVFAMKHIYENKNYICSELSFRFLERLARTPAFIDKTKAVSNVEFSERDIEILELIADGFTNIEIADKLFMSKRTVEGYRKEMLEKTETRNSPALVRFAIRNGLIS
jgi:DNA-binding NarL/FixJ family response regulator